MDTSAPEITVPAAAEPSGTATAVAATDGLRSFRRYTYWSMVCAPLVLLLLPTITGPVPFPPDPLGTMAFVGVLVVVAAVSRLTERHIARSADAAPLSTRQWRIWAVVGTAASLAVASAAVVAGDDILWAFAPAMVASLLLAELPSRSRHIGAAGAIAVAAIAGVAIGLLRGDDPLTAYPLGGALVTGFAIFLTLASLWTWRVVVQLDTARRTATRLAVANERLRFAADLHDIQGHHLQVIALKSELASRLMRADPDAAEHEMSAVRQLATDALRDTRAVVHGYRRTTLDAEIANATSVLASAGIEAQVHIDQDLRTDTLSDRSRHLLGLVLRETVTNILRHSAASHAKVLLTGDEVVELTVANDGADRDATRIGGLGVLAERLHAANGTLSWQRAGDWFEVRAQLPCGPPPEPTTEPSSDSSTAERT